MAAGLMLASAAGAAWSTYLYWLPCRGTMLEGTILDPYTDDGGSYEEYEKLDPAVKASMDACLRRMDGDISGQAPWTSELLVLAMVLAGVAWLTVVLGLRWRLRTKAVAALPGLGTVVIALAVAVTIGDAERGEDHHSLLTMLLVVVEWSALLAFAVIWVWQPEVRTRRPFVRLAVALWGTTAFGIFHQMLAYMIMVGFSERDWDEPPGTGYLTVATITISAILTAIVTLRTPRRAEDEPHQDHHSASITPPEGLSRRRSSPTARNTANRRRSRAANSRSGALAECRFTCSRIHAALSSENCDPRGRLHDAGNCDQNHHQPTPSRRSRDRLPDLVRSSTEPALRSRIPLKRWRAMRPLEPLQRLTCRLLRRLLRYSITNTPPQSIVIGRSKRRTAGVLSCCLPCLSRVLVPAPSLVMFQRAAS